MEISIFDVRDCETDKEPLTLGSIVMMCRRHKHAPIMTQGNDQRNNTIQLSAVQITVARGTG